MYRKVCNGFSSGFSYWSILWYLNKKQQQRFMLWLLHSRGLAKTNNLKIPTSYANSFFSQKFFGHLWCFMEIVFISSHNTLRDLPRSPRHRQVTSDMGALSMTITHLTSGNLPIDSLHVSKRYWNWYESLLIDKTEILQVIHWPCSWQWHFLISILTYCICLNRKTCLP